MGKKQKKNIQKISNNQNGQQTKAKNNESQNKERVKLSKKQKRKQKRIQKRNSLKQSKSKKVSQVQDQQQAQSNEQQNQQIQEQAQNNDNQIISQSLIQISSSQQQINQDQQQDIQLNHRGNNGFQSLIQEQVPDKIKHIQIKRSNVDQKQETLHIYHLKQDTFYQVLALAHQKLNTTHLNQTVTLKIIDQNLLKFGNKENSCSFILNGKIIQRQIQFIKSTVFKIIKDNSKIQKQQTQKLSKEKQKNKSKSFKDSIQQNIQKYLKPTTVQQTQQIMEFLRDFQSNQDCLIASRQKLHFVQTTTPFSNIDTKMIGSNNSLLILGKKNTGKSTLAQYLKNTYPNSVCILDCDIGRSLSVSGCVSLISNEESINLWIGEFTPFNCIKNYVSAIKQLYRVYREKYFSKKLIINTMGYLSGLGQMVIYEIYNIINPSQIAILNAQNENKGGHDNIGNIIRNIKTGNYLSKLLTSSGSDGHNSQTRQFIQKKVNLNIFNIKNEHAQSKGIPIRYENMLMNKKNFKNIIELIKTIKTNGLQKSNSVKLFEQDKLGNVRKLFNNQNNRVNMRILLIGKWFKSSQTNLNVQINQQSQNNCQNDSNLFRVFGIGFGFENQVFYCKKQIETVITPNIKLQQQINDLTGLLNQGVDFQKNFYLLNQVNLINFQLQYGQIPYLLPVIKGIGSKGTRNNPAKNL